MVTYFFSTFFGLIPPPSSFVSYFLCFSFTYYSHSFYLFNMLLLAKYTCIRNTINYTYSAPANLNYNYHFGIYVGASKRFMMTTLKKGSIHTEYLFNIFLKFSKQFNKIPQDQLAHDPSILKYFKDFLQEDSSVNSRAFQLALEISFTRRTFSTSALYEIFNKEFSIVDSLSKENNIPNVDHSTFFNSLQVNLLKQEFPKSTFSVEQSSTNGAIPNDLSPALVSMLNDNKTLTGNTFPDITINNIPYDFKIIKNPYNLRNHIYIYPLTELTFKEILKHLYDLDKLLSGNFLSPMISVSFKKSLSNKIAQTILDLNNTKNLAIKREIVHEWNMVILNSLEERNKFLGLPLFHLAKDENSSIPVPETMPEGILDYNKAKKILADIINEYSPELQSAIYKATSGSLGHIINTSTLD